MSLSRAQRSYRLARISALSALSVIGSLIHLPSPIPTVAFDSSPGFFAALFFGAGDGALVSGIGHLVTSILNGFPLGVLHIPIALGLGLAGATIGWINQLEQRWAFVPALVAGIGINTGLVVIAVPQLGWAATLSLVPFLLLASSVNAAVAGAAYVGVRGRIRL